MQMSHLSGVLLNKSVLYVVELFPDSFVRCIFILFVCIFIINCSLFLVYIYNRVFVLYYY